METLRFSRNNPLCVDHAGVYRPGLEVSVTKLSHNRNEGLLPRGQSTAASKLGNSPLVGQRNGADANTEFSVIDRHPQLKGRPDV